MRARHFSLVSTLAPVMAQLLDDVLVGLGVAGTGNCRNFSRGLVVAVPGGIAAVDAPGGVEAVAVRGVFTVMKALGVSQLVNLRKMVLHQLYLLGKVDPRMGTPQPWKLGPPQ